MANHRRLHLHIHLSVVYESPYIINASMRIDAHLARPASSPVIPCQKAVQKFCGGLLTVEGVDANKERAFAVVTFSEPSRPAGLGAGRGCSGNKDAPTRRNEP